MPRVKLSPAEKERRKHQRKAAAMTAAAAKSYGPLFADLAPTYTREDAYWQWRRTKAVVAEEGQIGACISAMVRFQLNCIETVAAHLLGRGTAKELAASLDKYPPSYRREYWRQMLAGIGRHVLKLECRTDPERANQWNRDGRYVVESSVWPPADYSPVLTAEEFDRRFPAWDRGELGTGHIDYPEPDDGGLFERVMARLPVGQTVEPTGGAG